MVGGKIRIISPRADEVLSEILESELKGTNACLLVVDIEAVIVVVAYGPGPDLKRISVLVLFQITEILDASLGVPINPAVLFHLPPVADGDRGQDGGNKSDFRGLFYILGVSQGAHAAQTK